MSRKGNNIKKNEISMHLTLFIELLKVACVVQGALSGNASEAPPQGVHLNRFLKPCAYTYAGT